jgi:hypothetical protein
MFKHSIRSSVWYFISRLYITQEHLLNYSGPSSVIRRVDSYVSINIDKKYNLKNMKDCDNSTRKIHISKNFILTYGQYAVVAYMYFTSTVITILHIL